MPATLVYDAGALIAAERGDALMWRLHRRALERGVEPVVPAPVLAQVWRSGPKQALLARLLRGCDEIGFSPDQARNVGAVLALAGTSDIVDAAVVLVAVERDAAVVTSDPEDLAHLAECMRARVPLHLI